MGSQQHRYDEGMDTPNPAVCAWCDGVGRSGRFVCEVCQPDALRTAAPLAVLKVLEDYPHGPACGIKITHAGTHYECSCWKAALCQIYGI